MLILTKTCTCCGEEKEFADFHRNKNYKWGFKSECVTCENKKSRERYHLNIEGEKVRSKTYRKSHLEESRIRSKKYEQENATAISERKRQFRLDNWDKIRAREKEYYTNNTGKWVHYNKKRETSKSNRIPSWSTFTDFLQIKAIYECSSRISKCLGISHHVDHIIPLQGKLVSGLHTPNNLQIIPATINFSKGNKWELCK